MAAEPTTEKLIGVEKVTHAVVSRRNDRMPKFKLHSVVKTKRYDELGLPAGVRVSIVEGPFKEKDGTYSYSVEIERPLPKTFKGNKDVELVPEEYLEAC
jgi:hypothetical protein